MPDIFQNYHPDYQVNRPDWTMLGHSYAGQRKIKENGSLYLPPTAAHIMDGYPNQGTVGKEAYDAYIKRAVYHDFFTRAVQKLVGVMHRKPADIQLPTKLEYLLTKATLEGESLQDLLRRVNEAQLRDGRCGLLLDLPRTPSTEAQFFLSLYNALSIINWDQRLDLEQRSSDKLNLLVLDESGPQRVGFEWRDIAQHRVLIIGDAVANETSGIYRQGVFTDTQEFNLDQMIAPVVRGQEFQEIPFIFINAEDMTVAPGRPPLLGLAELCLTIYRGEADYRHSLFMQGQDTLVITNRKVDEKNKDVRIGAGAVLDLKEGGDAKFIGVESDGLTEQREALNNDKAMAEASGAELLSIGSGQAESGEALNVRVAAQTASLSQIAIAGASGLRHILQKAAIWQGLDPEQVIVKPNTDFSSDGLTGQDLSQIMGAKMLGAPISLQSIHALMRERDMTNLTFEEEIELIAAEVPLVAAPTEDDNADDQ